MAKHPGNDPELLRLAGYVLGTEAFQPEIKKEEDEKKVISIY